MKESHPSEAVLPTLDKLGVNVPGDINVNEVATGWFQAFADCVETGNVDAVVDLFVEGAFWRDILALTWDFRTFEGLPRIRQFLQDRLASSDLRSIKLKDGHLELKRPYPDLAWIQGIFEFETNVGLGSGVIRLVPTASGVWKGHCIFTNLENLKGFPEKIGPHRNREPNHGKWADERIREQAFLNEDPTVLIVGAGQSGLEVAARLKALDIASLIIEKNPRLGDNWRNRYEALCLHDPVCKSTELTKISLMMFTRSSQGTTTCHISRTLPLVGTCSILFDYWEVFQQHGRSIHLRGR